MAAVHRAAEIHAVALRHDAMNPDHTAKPRMMPIENFQELGPVGVLKPYCTIIGARIRALTGARRTRPTLRHRPSRRRYEFSAAREIAKDEARQQST